MLRRCVVSVVFIGALALLACRRESSNEAASDKSGAEPPSSRPAAPPGPSALREALGIRGDVQMESQGSPVTPVASKRLKSHGGLGEMLEGDVFFFTADSVKVCGDQPAKGAAQGDDAKKHARVVVGIEVQVKAKSRLTFSPRELRLGSGGVVLDASLDLDRKLQGCTPLLKVSWLKKDDVIKGFVLFDVPTPEPKNLQLAYQPTRWGGAGQVRVVLPECVTCGGNPAAAKSGAVPKPAAGGY